ncbi:MAG: hypothetical protein PHV68_03860, partial [Candidatus Gastranaerophilales bacterium]|nr:hypothetical protein [Candidatus Gastranaerophilales bacterium]
MNLGLGTNNRIHRDKTSFESLGMLANPALTSALRTVDVDKFWGANAVDLGFMVLPRTAIDTTRNPESGIETLRRESSSLVVHTSIGLMGAAVAKLLSGN